MAIYLLRHGETEANATRVVQRPEVPLSARGRAQALRLAERLATVGISHIRSSDLARAVETARALGAATGAPVEVDPELAERSYGDVRGTAYADLRADIFAPDYEPPGGETWAVFQARVDRAWARIVALAAATPGHIAVVTHGLVLDAVHRRHLGGGPRSLGWANASVTLVDPPGTLRLVGCTAHLTDGAEGGLV